MNIMHKRITQNQSGLVSITISIVIMVVLTLIVLGFATIARREQRQALDRQLSTQAFYAAETGINDALEALKFDPTAEKPNCDNSAASPIYSSLSSQVDGTNVRYTCLLVDASLTTLEYGNIDTSKSNVIPVQSKNGSAVNSINLGWQDKNASSADFRDCPSAGNFPALSGWSGCTAGVLRVDLVPISGVLSRTNLMNNNFTVFLVPVSGGAGTVAYSVPAGQGSIGQANCTNGGTPKWCSLSITGLSANTYYLRVRSIYRANALTVTAYNAGSQLELAGVQAQIDSTGKASDVLRRVVVRVPIGANREGIPDFAIESNGSICKKFYVYPGNAVDEASPACSL